MTEVGDQNALENANIPSKVSNSAGLYVCNCTYYHALSEIFESELQTKAVFVHLPKLSEDFNIELLVESVKKIIEEMNATQKEMGQVMRKAKENFGNRADGKLLSSIVKKELGM